MQFPDALRTILFVRIVCRKRPGSFRIRDGWNILDETIIAKTISIKIIIYPGTVLRRGTWDEKIAVKVQVHSLCYLQVCTYEKYASYRDEYILTL